MDERRDCGNDRLRAAERKRIAQAETLRGTFAYGTRVTADAQSTDVNGVPNMNDKNTFETILKWTVVVILALVALRVVATVLGIAFVLGGFLLFRVLPLVLVVWLFFKAIEWLRGKDRGREPTLDV